MKLKCIKDVVMSNGEVAFKAEKDYHFQMNSEGEIFRATEGGVHYFRTAGADAWVNYFKVEMESAS